MSGIDRTQKIENDHADEQIEVEGSSISSKSEENEEPEQRKVPPRGNPGMFAPGKGSTVEGGYDPSEYSSLPVSGEVKELFKSIQRYTPVQIDIDTRLKAFVPEFIPAIGEVDAFLKMPRPDGLPQTLGLTVLDQPALNQSNQAKIQLEIGHRKKQYNERKNTKIHAIDAAEKKPKDILSWIKSVGDIHKTKQPPSVSYSRTMPDIDSLMQEWPELVENILENLTIPGEEIDLSLPDYSKMACSILDIPVYGAIPNALIQSLHVLFTLYSAFKENQHFRNSHDFESEAR